MKWKVGHGPYYQLTSGILESKIVELGFLPKFQRDESESLWS